MGFNSGFKGLMKNYLIQTFGCNIVGFSFIGVNGASFCVEK